MTNTTHANFPMKRMTSNPIQTVLAERLDWVCAGASPGQPSRLCPVRGAYLVRRRLARRLLILRASDGGT